MVFGSPEISNEEERLRALAEYRILGTKPEQCYDDITRIASLTCGTPISLMSLVDTDKQWFKSRCGFETQETSRDVSFCALFISKREGDEINKLTIFYSFLSFFGVSITLI